MSAAAPRVLVALPAGPVASWRADTLRALRDTGARVKTVRTTGPAECRAPHGALAALLFWLERHWSAAAPTGLEPAPSLPEEEDFHEPPDIRLSLAGDHAFPGHPPAGGDWVIGFPDTRDPMESARRAVLAGRDTTRVRLRRRLPDGTRDTRECLAGVNPVSARDTVRTTVALASVLPARLLRGWHRPAEPEPPESPGPARGAVRLLTRLLREARRDLISRKQWRLLLGENGRGVPDPAHLGTIPCPPDRIQADPFVFIEAGETRVFFEEMTYAGNRGYIVSGRWDGRRLVDLRPALATEHHLSYPQLLHLGGKLRMTVECARSGEVRLYDCRRWPHEWVPGPVLFDRPLIDPSLFEHEGRWWLLGNLPPAPGAKADGELHAFYSDDPLSGRWTPHAQNPVVSDARHARGAGRPYRLDGRLFRPAQDCAGGYGRRVVLREIQKLTPELFAETTVTDLRPPAGTDALHTLNHADGIFALDTARRIPRFGSR